jgi:hypothetical protein
VKSEDCYAGFSEESRRSIDVAARQNSPIRDKQRAAKSEPHRESAEPFNRPFAEDQSRAAVKIKRLHIANAFDF